MNITSVALFLIRIAGCEKKSKCRSRSKTRSRSEQFFSFFGHISNHQCPQGCRHGCDCGFRVQDGHAQDVDATLRHEVLGGLCGAFGPLLIAAVSYLIYKKFCKPCSPGQIGAQRQGMGSARSSRNPWDENNPSNGDRNRGRGSYGGGGDGNGGGGGGPAGRPMNRTRVSTPTSMYGELDSEMHGGAPPSYSSKQINSLPGSKWMNIHRNVDSDMTNQWLKNVNKIRQFY